MLQTLTHSQLVRLQSAYPASFQAKRVQILAVAPVDPTDLVEIAAAQVAMHFEDFAGNRPAFLDGVLL